MSLEHVCRARCKSFLTDKDRISGFMQSFFLLLAVLFVFAQWRGNADGLLGPLGLLNGDKIWRYKVLNRRMSFSEMTRVNKPLKCVLLSCFYLYKLFIIL